MKHKLEQWLPVFARVYHLQPSEFWELTLEQFQMFQTDLETLTDG